ncbi:hypothetical protein I5Q34_28825 [Streptomyces sp. AV19]|uniref:hypothetical protein n=1 Tax=Streptomyces sp. AV19 TaxID=2793068 RepID=UPI0018FEB323|nr:hypothetical protein [Streptomyces sp. AV19]MBH1938217.1 hypothetical protein [Streptomyces sp. AV19]MDG4536117.1 hypothetical protein [Streptomyces sp. AV19]
MTTQSTPQPDYRRRARAYAVFAVTVLGVIADLTLPLLRPSQHRFLGATGDGGGDSDG